MVIEVSVQSDLTNSEIYLLLWKKFKVGFYTKSNNEDAMRISKVENNEVNLYYFILLLSKHLAIQF